MRHVYLLAVAIALVGCATTQYVNDPICAAAFGSLEYRDARTGGRGAIAFSPTARLCYMALSAKDQPSNAVFSDDALKLCRDAGNADCKMYAINKTVVAQNKTTSWSMPELTPDQQAAMMMMAIGIQNASSPPAAAPSMKTSQCSSDFDCGIGHVCVKASQQLSFAGTCVTPVNQAGIQQYQSPQGAIRSERGCQFDTQCDIAMGFRCVIPAGQLYGLCLKN
jgi:hypothetical protein